MYMWHMPHGISPHTPPKSSNVYYLLYKCSTEQHLFTQHLALQPHSGPLLMPLRLYQVYSLHSYLLKTTAFLILGKPPELWHKLIAPGNTLSHE